METLPTFLPLESEAEMEGHHEEGRVTSARQVPSPRWPLGLHSEDRVDLLQESVKNQWIKYVKYIYMIK